MVEPATIAIVTVCAVVGVILVVAIFFYLHTVGKFRRSLDELDEVQSEKSSRRASRRATQRSSRRGSDALPPEDAQRPSYVDGAATAQQDAPATDRKQTVWDVRTQQGQQQAGGAAPDGGNQSPRKQTQWAVPETLLPPHIANPGDNNRPTGTAEFMEPMESRDFNLGDPSLPNQQREVFKNPLFGMDDADAGDTNDNGTQQQQQQQQQQEEEGKLDVLYGDRYAGTDLRRVVPVAVDWGVPDSSYYPTEYTAAAVLAGPVWADPSDTSGLRFNEIDEVKGMKVDRRSHHGTYAIVDQVPLNVRGRTGLRGRGTLGRWGPNHAADPVVTRWAFTPEGDPVYRNGRRVLEFVAIRRRDNGMLAFPGGFVDPGEAVSETIKREFSEEAFNSMQMSASEQASLRRAVDALFASGQSLYKGYVYDDRNTDNAWIETTCMLYHDENGDALGNFSLAGGDDAMDAHWEMAREGLHMHAGHDRWLAMAAQRLGCFWSDGGQEAEVSLPMTSDTTITNVMFAPSLPGQQAASHGSGGNAVRTPTGSVGDLSTTSANEQARTPKNKVTAADLARLTHAQKDSDGGVGKDSHMHEARIGGHVPGMEGDVNLELDEYNDTQANNTLRREEFADVHAWAQENATVFEEVQALLKGHSDVLGVFDTKYLGHVKTTNPGGSEVVEACIKIVREEKHRHQGVVQLEISPRGIVIQRPQDSKGGGGEIIRDVPIKSISFTGVDRTYKKLFAFIANNGKEEGMLCHVFQCKAKAKDVSDRITDAFRIAQEIRIDPFALNRAAPTTEQIVTGVFKESQVARQELKVKMIIGHGQYGKVFLADRKRLGSDSDSTSSSSTSSGGSDQQVAVKLMRPHLAAKGALDFLGEAAMMMNFDNEFCLKLVGTCMERAPWLIVVDFMQYKDLGTVLRQCKRAQVFLRSHEQLTILHQVSRGLTYLAKHRFVHRDVAARNILLHHDNHVKIGDFGLTRKIPDGQDYWRLDKVGRLPVKHMAVESLTQKRFYTASDVWSFGVFLWEMLAYGAPPWESQGVATKDVRQALQAGTRLEKPEFIASDEFTPEEEEHARDVFDDMYVVASSCWAATPDDRPTFPDLRDTLAQVLENELLFHGKARPVRDVGHTCYEALEQLKQRKRKIGQRGGSIIKVGTGGAGKSKQGNAK